MFIDMTSVDIILHNKYMQKLHKQHGQEATIQRFYICFGLRNIKYWTWEVYTW